MCQNFPWLLLKHSLADEGERKTKKLLCVLHTLVLTAFLSTLADYLSSFNWKRSNFRRTDELNKSCTKPCSWDFRSSAECLILFRDPPTRFKSGVTRLLCSFVTGNVTWMLWYESHGCCWGLKPRYKQEQFISSYSVIDLYSTRELFTTVYDMLMTLIHGTLASDPNDHNKWVYLMSDRSVP